MEMSRQRMRTSVLESSTEICPHCGGSGHVRSVSSVALQLLRAIEETLLKSGTHNLIVRSRSDVALYVLNNKRAHLRSLEERFRILIAINADATITGQPPFVIERGEQVMTVEQAKAIAAQAESTLPARLPEEPDDEQIVEEGAETLADRDTVPPGEQPEGRSRRRRRGRRGRGGRGREEREPSEQSKQSFTRDTVPEHTVTHGEDFEGAKGFDADTEAPAMEGGADTPAGEPQGGEGEQPRRRRGRRGGRRNRRNREGEGEHAPAFQEGNGSDAPAPEFSPTFEAPEEPAPPKPAMAATPAPAEEPPAPQPRRGSTVRERVSFFGGETPSPATPIPPDEHADDSDRPRRTGWWSKRG
jgi:ribonuclease E